MRSVTAPHFTDTSLHSLLSSCQLLLWKFSLGKNFTAISSWHFVALQTMEILGDVVRNGAYRHIVMYKIQPG